MLPVFTNTKGRNDVVCAVEGYLLCQLSTHYHNTHTLYGNDVVKISTQPNIWSHVHLNMIMYCIIVTALT